MKHSKNARGNGVLAISSGAVILAAVAGLGLAMHGSVHAQSRPTATPARPGSRVVRDYSETPPAQPSVVQEPVVPTSSLPTPRPPYVAGSAHPLTGTPNATAVADAVAASGLPEGPNGSFVIDSGWQIGNSLQVWTGHFSESATPALVTIQGSASAMYLLNMNGAPGPAMIRGVNGNWILIEEGLGYEVFNYTTDAIESSNQDGAPGATTRIGHT